MIKMCASFHISSRILKSDLKWSYVHGASNIPLLGITVGKQLQAMVESCPDRDAMVFFQDRVKLTFGELLEKSDKLAAGLQALGIQRGDCFGILGPNSAEWVLTQYASARAGFILVNINPSYKRDELKYALLKSGCKGIVTAPSFKSQNYVQMLTEIIPELTSLPQGAPINSKELPNMKHIITMGPKHYPGTLLFDDVLNQATPSQIQNIVDTQDLIQFDDPVNIQFTSGTTGSPKGAVLTHHNIVNNSYFVGLRCGYHVHDAVICVPVPLYHCFGMVMACLQSITHGATCVWPSQVFDVPTVLKSIEEFRCTSLYGVPTMIIDILNHPLCEKTDTSSLVTGIMAGSPCPIETMKAVLEKLKIHKITVCYGSTETSPVTLQSTGECSFDKRVSTVGKVLDHQEVKIVDTEGRIVPIGTSGELCTRGSSTMLGYWKDPEKTKDVITPDQWYHTGDLAIMTEEGYCKISGRIKDMLIRGGENIYPLEIEQILYKHPKIKDVQVIGVPDTRLGEQVCAWIVPKTDMTLTEQEVKEFCKDKMARYKIPHYVIFVEDYPKTVSGKVQKYIMRERSIEQLGLVCQ
ncbi:medium-chain acyl-CoA ligase ACSF2, mitochondrial-like [Physella acuta]|uniref:medium-chain acyl-CoA ligase ACSF2, mitochondrial-like n=1 Tax=Physella acuta TaxID=109671 RepID=UPI0027DE7185|nr:medium-chain acyl-CoA ligase ACSF2, mitochondrial-like [Physella acuta]